MGTTDRRCAVPNPILAISRVVVLTLGLLTSCSKPHVPRELATLDFRQQLPSAERAVSRSDSSLVLHDVDVEVGSGVDNIDRPDTSVVVANLHFHWRSLGAGSDTSLYDGKVVLNSAIDGVDVAVDPIGTNAIQVRGLGAKQATVTIQWKGRRTGHSAIVVDAQGGWHALDRNAIELISP